MLYKVISLWQPWASLIPLGFKDNETRSWYTGYKGMLLIHAAKKIIPFEQLFDELSFGQRFAIMDAICREYGDYDKLPTGAIVAKTYLKDILPVEKVRNKISMIERACGDYSDGRFAWQLDDIEKINPPISCNGHQGLWNWEGTL